jgi:hypothetical protein
VGSLGSLGRLLRARGSRALTTLPSSAFGRAYGNMLMDFIWQRSRTLGIIALVLTVTGISIAVARPHSFINPDLGAEWQCSHTLFVLACSHSTR